MFKKNYLFLILGFSFLVQKINLADDKFSDGALCSVSSVFIPKQAFFQSSWLKEEVETGLLKCCSDDDADGWRFVDQTSMVVGEDVLCLSDLEEFERVEKCFQSDFANTIFAVPFSFGALMTFYLKNIEMGGRSGSNFKRFLEYFEEKLGISSADKNFSRMLLNQFGFSLKNLEQYFLYKEVSIGFFNCYRPIVNKLLNETEKILSYNGISLSDLQLEEKYDFGLKTSLTESDLELYEKGLLDVEFVLFEDKDSKDIDGEILAVLQTLKDGQISEPIKFENKNEYFLVKCEKKKLGGFSKNLTNDELKRSIDLLLIYIKPIPGFTFFPCLK